ncbi:MAG: cysteine desulfurase-like protein [Anaerolineales bacterium]|nr:cysteine desulfurase-like protein [Anaerolineae bacterium]PWB56322.1 MAG: cysteine desulfurase-like protein [Anaerolineales bacterium]
MPLDLTAIRSQFPALSRDCIYLDNPAGTQVARTVLDRMQDYLVKHNANHEGAFTTSRESDALVEETRQAAADFLNASDPHEIVFGPNMTSLTFNISRSLVRTFNPGDRIVVTWLDHDANVTPWVMAAEDRGCEVIRVDFHAEDGTLDMEAMQAAIEKKPRLVAVGYASNALGTVNPVDQITRMAHEAGALVYIDAVQYAPHGPIDVQRLDSDFLVCSSYKFFGPHMGVLYGKYDLLDRLTAYKVRPAPSDPPGKFETGTGNFEGMCGVLGALEYLQWVGETYGEEHAERYAVGYNGRRLSFKLGMSAIRAYEFELSRALLDILAETPGVTVYGIKDTKRLEERVPTCAFTLQGKSPRQVAEQLDEANIYVWDGNYYALEVTKRLGLEDSGGMVRVGPVHYNTLEEIRRFGEVLGRITAG